MADNIVTKSAVSVTEMARMVGLSRARFYQLVRRGTFPPADQDTLTGRPCYFEEKQRQVLEVRRRNCGVDGSPILFYSRRRDLGQPKPASRPAKPKTNLNNYADVAHYLEQAKITMTAAQVEATLKELFPEGTEDKDTGFIVNAIIERFRGQNSSGSA
jgi:hypothetical protein